MNIELSPVGNQWTQEEKDYFEKVSKICKVVPFSADWVKYKGDIVFAQIDYEKSARCGRPIIEIGYCATQVIVNHAIDASHNYSPDTFKWCHLSSSSWKP